MKNQKITLSKKILITVSMVAAASLSMIGSTHYSDKGTKFSNVGQGLGTCFERVTQTFTAIMISDLSSSFVTKDFMGMTSDCLSEVSKQASALIGSTKVQKSVDKMASDLHWFHEKIEKVTKLQAKENIDMSRSSLIGKYEKLEGQKSTLDTRINKANYTNGKIETIFIGLTAMLSFAAIFFGVWSFRSKKKNDLYFSEIEKESEKLILEETQVSAAYVDRVSEKVFSKLGMPRTYFLINDAYSQAIESSAIKSFSTDDAHYADQESMPELTLKSDESVSEKSTSFSETMSLIVEKIQNRIFTHGVVLEMDLGDDFNVKAEQEELGQLLFNVFSFSLEQSVKKNNGRRISIKSNALGGTGYFKIRMSNSILNVHELNYLNGNEEDPSSVDMNLVLMKEVSKDLGGSFSVKNILGSGKEMNESVEMEFAFNRPSSDNTSINKEVTSVLKGKKKDILKAMLQSEL